MNISGVLRTNSEGLEGLFLKNHTKSRPVGCMFLYRGWGGGVGRMRRLLVKVMGCYESQVKPWTGWAFRLGKGSANFWLWIICTIDRGYSIINKHKLAPHLMQKTMPCLKRNGCTTEHEIFMEAS